MGDTEAVNKLSRKSRIKEIRLEIVIAQPGVSQANHTADQARVLGAADSYLKETVGVNLAVIASS